MNFLSNVLDSLPVVGHVKGVVHYAVGDKEGGNKAMYQSSRTSAVLAGGAAGCLLGPAGAAAGAVYAGMITDGLASIAMDEPQGIVQSIKTVADDINDGKNPTGSIVSAGAQIGLDAVGGLGMGGISSAASSISEKAVAKTMENVGKKVVSTVGEEVIEKSVKITAEEVAKMVTKKVSEKAVKQVITQAAIQTEVVLVTAHIGINASKRTEEERAEKEKRENEERDRREREKRVKEERDRKERDKRANEEREQREGEKRANEERNRREREKRANEEKDRKEREKRANEERKQKEREERATFGTSSGPWGPPQGNQDNNKKSEEKSEPDYFDIFLKLLKKLLKLIYGNDKEPFSSIFKNLSDGQIEYLVKVIERLMKSGTLDEVVELVIRMFKGHFPKEISFTNILSLLEFIQTYISEKLDERIKISRGTDSSKPKLKYKERRERIIRDIVNQENIVQKLVDLFKTLQNEIEVETSGPNSISPNFRDIFSAVYHYFKHRCVPGDGILSVKEYYDWVRKLLDRLKKTTEYRTLENSRDPTTCVYEVYVVIFGRRFRIVVEARGGKIVLSSAYVVSIIFPTDKDGVVIIKITKKHNKKP